MICKKVFVITARFCNFCSMICSIEGYDEARKIQLLLADIGFLTKSNCKVIGLVYFENRLTPTLKFKPN